MRSLHRAPLFVNALRRSAGIQQNGFFHRLLGSIAASAAEQQPNSVPVLADNTRPPHTPVLLRETIAALDVKPDRLFVDLTFGAGGHSRAILERGGHVVAIDRDPSVSKFAADLKQEFGDRFEFRVAKFTQLRDVLSELSVPAGSVWGILADCGCSSMQMDSSRGFAISKPDALLDMRMNPEEEGCPSAANVVNNLSAEHLVKIFKTYGEEKNAYRIAEAIVNFRYEMKRIRTTREFCQIVETAFAPGQFRTDLIGRRAHVATKAMMALRIFVNDELNELNRVMAIAFDVLRKDGRAAVLTFHSLEDRIVKRHFLGIDMEEPVSHSLAQKYRNAGAWHEPEELVPKWELVLRSAVTPDADEVERNPRSRSAKLRAAIKKKC